MANFGAGMAILSGGKILLTMREDFHAWCLPGGEV
jgi:ADP-ribose pyrophosphatase YjhB (NUDIX family)